MEKKKYYVNLASLEISQIKYDNNDSYIIHATDEEVADLRNIMNHMDSALTRTFFRAHVPIMPYHKDASNDDYDQGLTEAFQMIHDLGDNSTKEFIESIVILGDNHM
ncbi:hydrolase [Ornithinibacillus halophilus]|uniref:Hydrolase n=1 Tax=Ornithinibacillus halophilus TaxID=930117 RepID=A0A1M5K7L5_9BACI|nr:hydrolase [Ornithinibacillus halophilus]SHG48787.1 hypothetical protein SAMN05216225_103621 [Ornithinibacillus halophilus]